MSGSNVPLMPALLTRTSSLPKAVTVGRDGGLPVRLAGDVELHEPRLAAGRGDLLDHLARPPPRARRPRRPCAPFPREDRRLALPHAARPTRDQRDLPRQPHVAPPPFRRSIRCAKHAGVGLGPAAGGIEKDPFPNRGDGRPRARMEPSRSGAAHACRVVRSIPPAAGPSLTPAADTRREYRREAAACTLRVRRPKRRGRIKETLWRRMCWSTARIKGAGSGSRSRSGCAPRGIACYAPTLDGCAERHDQVRPGITVATHGQEIAKLLFYEDLERVDARRDELGRHGDLQGRRAGARPDRAARLRRRAGADARRAGRRHRQARGAPTTRTRSRQDPRGPTPRSGSSPISIPTLAPGRWPATRRIRSRRSRRPSSSASFWSQAWPTTVIRCRRAVNPPEAHQRRTAERLKGDWHELDTGHYPMLSQPEELTRLLLAPVS